MHDRLAPLALVLACCVSSALAEPCRPPGDVAPSLDGDGAVTVADVMVVLRWAVGLEEPPAELGWVGDVSPTSVRASNICGGPCPLEAWGDGTVDVGDITVMLRAVVGLDDLGWPLRRVGSAYLNAPWHVAVRWLVGDYPGECSEFLAVTHDRDGVPWQQEPCADWSIEPWGEASRVTCYLGEPDDGRGVVGIWWRGVAAPPWDAPSSMELLTTEGAWVRITP